MRSAEARATALAPRDMARSGLCVGCGGCVARASGGRAHMRLDAYGQLEPAGDKSWYARRAPGIARTCPFSPTARDEDAIAAARFPLAPQRDPFIGRFETAWVGHVEEGGFRADGSSGGLTSWVAAELLRSGAVDAVAHVAPAERPAPGAPLFRYRLSRTEADLRAGAKSRYCPVELSGVLAEIRATPGRYAVIGIPCFVKATHLLRAEEPVLAERITHTLGLFCGHMKSARMAESFAWQLGARIEEVDAFDYRLKDSSRPASWYAAWARLKDGSERRGDWWGFADGDWGAGFFQSPACNACDDVAAETADIAFGDAWVEPYAADGRGTNVVVARSPEMDALVRRGIAAGRLALAPVDADFVRRTQAAGFRHRREGLAYRLTWSRRGVRPRKRVAPGAAGLTLRRRAVYRLRAHISAWSHRVFWLARRLRAPALYTRWARTELAVYQAFAWSRGSLGRMLDRAEKALGA